MAASFQFVANKANNGYIINFTRVAGGLGSSQDIFVVTTKSQLFKAFKELVNSFEEDTVVVDEAKAKEVPF